MEWGKEESKWLAICAGTLCQLCEAPLPDPEEAGTRFCAGCAPPGSVTPHAIMVSVDHHDRCWCMQFHSDEIPPFTYWLLGVSTERMTELLQRMPMAASQRAGIAQALSGWGRTSVHVYLNQRQYNRLLHAYRDPRNGYDKLQAKDRGDS